MSQTQPARTRNAAGLDSRIESLRARHTALEGQLHALLAHPSASDDEIADVKRRKLALKDELTALEAN